MVDSEPESKALKRPKLLIKHLKSAYLCWGSVLCSSESPSFFCWQFWYEFYSGCHRSWCGYNNMITSVNCIFWAGNSMAKSFYFNTIFTLKTKLSVLYLLLDIKSFWFLLFYLLNSENFGMKNYIFLKMWNESIWKLIETSINIVKTSTISKNTIIYKNFYQAIV